MMKKPRPNLAYKYTGPDHEGIRCGSVYTVRQLAKLLAIPYPTLYARFYRGLIKTQGQFNALLNPELSSKELESPMDIQTEINSEYKEHQKRLKLNIIIAYETGFNRAEIAKRFKTSTSTINHILRVWLNPPIDDTLNTEHLCKCPRCGEKYYHTGFYTGRGLWWRYHEPSKCRSMANTMPLSIYSVSPGLNISNLI